jgi:hypothetical protein
MISSLRKLKKTKHDKILQGMIRMGATQEIL